MNAAILSWLWLYLCMYSVNWKPSLVPALVPHGFVHTPGPETVFCAFRPPW